MKVKIKKSPDPDADLIKDAICICKCHNDGQLLKDMCEKCQELHKIINGDSFDCDCRCHLTWCSDCEKNHRMIPIDKNPIVKVTLYYKNESKVIEMCKNESEKSISKAIRTEFKIDPKIELNITSDSNSYRAENA